MHSGVTLPQRFKENAPNNPVYAKKPNHKAIREFELNEKMDCIFFIKTGGLMLRDCTLSLNSHPKGTKSKIPCLVSMPFTFLNMTGCTCIGNESNHNAGIITINSDIQVSETSFEKFMQGACWVAAKPWNDIVIKDCNIHDC